MGADIGPILVKHNIEFEALSGYKIAIDAYNTIYQFLSIIRQRDGTPLMDRSGKVTSHLSGLLYRTIRLMELSIQPIFVFDGEPPKFKEKTIAARAAMKEKAMRKMHEARERGEEDLKTYAQGTVRITDEIITESKLLLDLLGIPVVQAPSEGEAEAAYLAKEGIVYAVGSQDYDAVLFGTPKLVRNLTLSGKRKLPKKGIWIDIEPEMIDLNESLRAVGLDRRRLVWAAIMVGTDYNPGIKGIGPKKGLDIAKKATSIKNAFELAKAADQFTDEIEEIERFYMEPPAKDAPIKFKEVQKDKLIDFLCGKHDFSIERIESAIGKLEKKPSDSGQSKLEGWF